jgi:predicted Zn-dependent protease
MPPLDEREARALIEKVLGRSTAEHCEVSISGGRNGNVRFARNTVSTSGVTENTALRVTSSFGKQAGSASANAFDDATIASVVTRSEELARLMPEDPEWMPPLGPQQYSPTTEWFEPTARYGAAERAAAAAGSVLPSREKKLITAGFLSHADNWSAQGNSSGLFGWRRSTGIDFSVTSRTEDGTGSGYATRDEHDASKLDADAASRIAMEKAEASRNPRTWDPGKYTVVLEPDASVELIGNMMFSMDLRRAEEGRSFLAAPGGKTRMGEQLLDPRITIVSDPADPRSPSSPWDGDGQARKRTVWFDKGVVANLACSRYWAQKTGREPLPGPGRIQMSGGSASLEELIKGTELGVLVTRMWYIRSVDPQTLLYTGLTRDGTFAIEEGRIAYAIKNFRFNESPVTMLANVEELGSPLRRNGHLVPPMRVRDFTFTSLSDAV